MADFQWQELTCAIVTEAEVIPAVNREGDRGLVLRLTLESPSGQEKLVLDGSLGAEIAVLLVDGV